MHYYQVYTKNTPEPLTWSSLQKLHVGARVRVPFRGKSKIGIIVKSVTKPEFKTLEVLEILDKDFIPTFYITWTYDLAEKHFSNINKIFSLLLPDEFLQKIDPVKKSVFYQINAQKKDTIWRSEGQKHIQKILTENLEVSEIEILKVVTKATLQNLVKNESILKKSGSTKPGITLDFETKSKLAVLTKPQQQVLTEINQSKIPSLLWGITGSGKTEIYKHLASQSAGQILLLVPEIALTPQLLSQFYSLYPDAIAVWHSKLSAGQKVQEWARIKSGEAKILIGTRSAVTVPFRNLKTIIIDEEHEWTYKSETSPRFQMHDLVRDLAAHFEVKIILGSATPRLESWHKAKDGEYQLIKLTEKPFSSHPPNIHIIDLKSEHKRGNYSPISGTLRQQIIETLQKKEQVILFLNKRGFASSTLCVSCGHNFQCPHCDTPLKAHGSFQQKKKFLCHYCGHLEKFPEQCLHCQTENFEFKGWGTQQLEQILQHDFPSAKVLRADRDTITGKSDFENLWRDFSDHKADILLGTQMITKGLDFGKVSLVGIISADTGLNLPDFRAEERVWQLLLQVMGRTGRRDTPGNICLQTFNPDHRVFQFLSPLKVPEFLDQELVSRSQHQFPPLAHLCKLTFVDPKKEVSFVDSQNIFKKIREIKTDAILEVTWAPGFFPRLHGKYWFHVFIKSDSHKSLHRFVQDLNLDKNVRIDMSPISLL